MPRGKCSSAAIAAVISMRLLVVSFSKPDNSFSWPSQRSTAPQPPGPGLPLQAPSVKISTVALLSSEAIGLRIGDAAVEAQLSQVFERILGLDQRAFGMVEPVVEPRQQEPQRAAARQHRQRRDLGRPERPDSAVLRQHRPRLGDVEATIRLEAPGIEADRQIVGEEVGAGEIEVDEPRYLLAAEEHVIGEQIGVYHAPGAAGRAKP